MKYETLKFDIDQGLGIITLNRPEAANAINKPQRLTGDDTAKYYDIAIVNDITKGAKGNAATPQHSDGQITVRDDVIEALAKDFGATEIASQGQNKSFILLKNQILFSKPTKYSKPIAKIFSGRLLLVKKCKLKWCKIKTDKYEGWITNNNLWGSIE